jgi:hypothetical protein
MRDGVIVKTVIDAMVFDDNIDAPSLRFAPEHKARLDGLASVA